MIFIQVLKSINNLNVVYITLIHKLLYATGSPLS